MDYNRSGSGDIDAVTITTGAIVTSAPLVGCTLAATTYYFPLGSQMSAVPSECSLDSVHLKWDTGVTATVTLETCNFPATIGSAVGGGPDVTDFSVVAGNWIQENPSTAYVAISPAGAATVVSLTVTIPGGTAGGCTIHVGNIGTRRARIKIVATVGGVLRANVHGKNAA